MMSRQMERRKRGWMPPLGLTFLLLLWVCTCAAQDDVFNCHQTSSTSASKGLIKLPEGDPLKVAAIHPRGNVEVMIGGPPTEVMCRFNSSIVNAKNVYFTTKAGPIDYHIHNVSTIKTLISHSQPQKYVLYCNLKRRNKENKRLCSQTVMAGYEPLDIINLNCRADNNLILNCTWSIPENPIRTKYEKPQFLVENFLTPSLCPSTELHPYTSCYWDNSQRPTLRTAIDLLINASNIFGEKQFAHHIDIMDVVYPHKVHAQVLKPVLNTRTVKVMWNLTSPLDVLPSGLWHNVEYRLASSSHWINVTYFFHKYTTKVFEQKKAFSVETTLPYANTEYVFRVRIHSGSEGRRQDLWSPFDELTVKTYKEIPTGAPMTIISSFETVEVLDSRDIYVNFQDIDSIYYGGDSFSYDIKVFSDDEITPLEKQPDERTNAYFKYKAMNYLSYRFEITPMNEEGLGLDHSEVLVPKSDCLPKKTEMLTVITKSTTKGKIFSLYWIPSSDAKDHCPGAGPKIDSYTIFWCKKSNGDRCKTKLHWLQVTELELVVKDLAEYTTANITIYEKNFTNLEPNMIYSFGIAANNGQYSSGIKWARCIVDDTEAPGPPAGTDVVDSVEKTTTAIVKWSLKCPQISSIPLGFNISYCKANTPDFGHCYKKVEHIVVNSPSATSVAIRNLDAGYSYIFAVSILSIIGEGLQSNPKMLQLRNDLPDGPPILLKINETASTRSSLSISWEPPQVEKRNGRIARYDITITKLSAPSFTWKKTVDAEEDDPGTKKNYVVLNLLPYTNYEISVESCVATACSKKYPAILTVLTKAAKPKIVRNFEIDVYNWRLGWTPNRCDSKNCSYEITSNELINGTKLNVSIPNEEDKKYLQLSDLGLQCNTTEMSFEIREVGVNEDGLYLYGNSTFVTKPADLCPSGWLTWWALFLIITLGFFLALLLFIAGRFGYGNIRNTIKDCYQNINLPKGIQAATESGKEIHRKEFPPELMNIRRTSEPSLLLLHPDNCPVNTSFPHEDKLLNQLNQLNRASVSSEEVHLIDVDGDRHGRNLSGSSEHSSAQDSAVMSASPSVVDTDHDAMSSELGPNQNHETMLRLRNTGPAYVQQGAMLEKLSEGYVTAHSVPSLPHLYKDGYNSSQQSTPNLNNSHHLATWQNARRASTGYISMPDSELDSPNKNDPITLSRVPVNRIPGMPPYSRHSFSPNLKPELIKAVSPTTGLQVGYVTISGTRSPSPPTSGYVSAGDPLKRPPSLPLIKTGEPLPLGAYCKIASRENSTASPGYVSAGPADNISTPVGNNITPASKNPYVSYGEAALISAGKPDISGPIPPYVELSDVRRWAMPMNRVPTLASAPVENGRIGRIGQMPRPNTTEATMGHRKTDGSPTLSKQSSGYVSQEMIPHCDSVLMSPKRLLSQSAVPHSILMSPSHQASMV